MSTPYSDIPTAPSIEVFPFRVDISDDAIDELKTLLKYSKLPKDTFENNTEDGSFGIPKGWVEDGREYWGTQFDWYAG
jgi:microsomal epoxide hydrolase